MAIFLPRKWRHQPQGAVQIDWSNPLTDGLFAVEVPGSIFWSRNGPPTLVGTLQRTVGPDGQGVRSPAYAQANYWDLGDYLVSSSLAGSTVLAIFDYWRNEPGFTSDAYPDVIAAVSGTSVGGLAHLYVVHTSGQADLRFVGGHAFGMYASGAGYSPGNLFSVTQRVSVAASFRNFQNINRMAVRSASSGSLYNEVGDITGLSTHTVRVKFGTYFNDSRSMYMPVYIRALWTRPFRRNELEALRDEPWQLFRAPAHRIYFDLGAAKKIPVLSMPGVIDVTSTSARPRVYAEW